MEVIIPGLSGPVGGTGPIVIIGPNGVGKTQLGVAIARANGGDRIAALRNVEISSIPMTRLEQANAEVRNAFEQLLNAHWRQSYELQQLLAEILAEDRELAVEYRSQRESNAGGPVDKSLTETRLVRIVTIWNRHFPGRTIKFDYSPKVTRVRKDGTTSTYDIERMPLHCRQESSHFLVARLSSPKR